MATKNKLSVYLVKEGITSVNDMYVFIRLERKLNGVMKSIERLDVLHTGEITEKPAIR